ncbi:hypothetical protein HMN09_00940000 [Mycena chlorophos]|uniref:Uncharacterized protein n=1 Tax=Mycena chlorophos TaxID=658473 RepID=A0A8H6SKX1_MYCCL|nr:hypothetical protein HMN09_00940000 [Mycena chlorophos]
MTTFERVAEDHLSERIRLWRIEKEPEVTKQYELMKRENDARLGQRVREVMARTPGKGANATQRGALYKEQLGEIRVLCDAAAGEEEALSNILHEGVEAEAANLKRAYLKATMEHPEETDPTTHVRDQLAQHPTRGRQAYCSPVLCSALLFENLDSLSSALGPALRDTIERDFPARVDALLEYHHVAFHADVAVMSQLYRDPADRVRRRELLAAHQEKMESLMVLFARRMQTQEGLPVGGEELYGYGYEVPGEEKETVRWADDGQGQGNSRVRTRAEPSTPGPAQHEPRGILRNTATTSAAPSGSAFRPVNPTSRRAFVTTVPDEDDSDYDVDASDPIPIPAPAPIPRRRIPNPTAAAAAPSTHNPTTTSTTTTTTTRTTNNTNPTNTTGTRYNTTPAFFTEHIITDIPSALQALALADEEEADRNRDPMAGIRVYPDRDGDDGIRVVPPRQSQAQEEHEGIRVYEDDGIRVVVSNPEENNSDSGSGLGSGSTNGYGYGRQYERWMPSPPSRDDYGRERERANAVPRGFYPGWGTAAAATQAAGPGAGGGYAAYV